MKTFSLVILKEMGVQIQNKGKFMRSVRNVYSNGGTTIAVFTFTFQECVDNALISPLVSREKNFMEMSWLL